MKRAIIRLNIEHFRRLLTTELDDIKRQTVIRLLAEEEGKLAALDGSPATPSNVKCAKCGAAITAPTSAALLQPQVSPARVTYFNCEQCAHIQIVDQRRTLNQHEPLDDILANAMADVGASMGNIQLLDHGNQTLFIASQYGFRQDFLDHFRTVAASDDCACGIALRAKKRIIIEDIETDDSVAAMRPIARAAGFQAVQSTPLIGRDNKPLGMLSTHFDSKHRPSEHDFNRLASHIERAIEFVS